MIPQRYIIDDGNAYYIDNGEFCHAPVRIGGTIAWEHGGSVDSYEEEWKPVAVAFEAALRTTARTEDTPPPAPTPRFPIGTRFLTRGKHPRECTVTDYLITRNLAGEIVRTRYVATHTFCNQNITETDIVETTIARNLIA
jgi:hypothetical protein